MAYHQLPTEGTVMLNTSAMLAKPVEQKHYSQWLLTKARVPHHALCMVQLVCNVGACSFDL